MSLEMEEHHCLRGNNPLEGMSVKCPGPGKGKRCGNKHHHGFRLLRNIDNNELMGFYCKDCKTEWLLDEQIPTTSSGDEKDFMMVGDRRFFRHNLGDMNVTFSGTESPLDKKEVDSVHQLSTGDHITWERYIGYWHHAIVTDKQEDTITTMEWTVPGVIKERSYREPFKEMYRLEYPPDVTDANSTPLVLARAKSREGHTGYDLYRDNCETFATYCKTGRAVSYQVSWAHWKWLQMVSSVFQRFTFKLIVQIIFAEGVEEVFEKPAIGRDEAIGAGILFVIQALFAVREIYFAFLHKHSIHRNRQICNRVCEALGIWVCATGLSIGFEYLFSKELKICGFGGSILGGILGAFIGTVLGHQGHLCCSECCHHCCEASSDQDVNASCLGCLQYISTLSQRLSIKDNIRILTVVVAECVAAIIEVHKLKPVSDQTGKPIYSYGETQAELVTELIAGVILVVMEIFLLCIMDVRRSWIDQKNGHISSRRMWARNFLSLLESIVFCALAIGCSIGFRAVFFNEKFCRFDGAVVGGLFGAFVMIVGRIVWYLCADCYRLQKKKQDEEQTAADRKVNEIPITEDVGVRPSPQV